MSALADKRASDAIRFLHQLELANVIIVMVAVAVTHLAVGAGMVLSGVLAGGLIGVLNLRAMIWLGGKVLRGPKRSRAFYGVLFASKLVVLMTVIWLALSYLPIAPLGFLIGFSGLLPAVLAMTVKKSLEPVEATQNGESKL